MDIFVGIDPGQTGALAAIDGERRVLLMARTPRTTAGMADLVRKVLGLGEIKLVALEHTQVLPGNGVVGMHNYGRQAGAWEGILVTLGVPLVQPYPKAWQPVVCVPPGPETQSSSRRKEAKLRSLASAEKLFGVSLTPSQGGIADALHMALWGLRVHTASAPAFGATGRAACNGVARAAGSSSRESASAPAFGVSVARGAGSISCESRSGGSD